MTDDGCVGASNYNPRKEVIEYISKSLGGETKNIFKRISNLTEGKITNLDGLMEGMGGGSKEGQAFYGFLNIFIT